MAIMPGLNLLDWLWPLWDKEKKSLHDHVCEYVCRNT